MSLSVAAVEAIALDIPMVEPLATSRHAYATIGYVVVRVRLSDGTAGHGEARESVQITGETRDGICAAINRELGPAVIGLDPFDLDGAHRAMSGALAGNTAAKSAVDMALYDAAGQFCGRPVSNLLGGAPRGEIASSKAISVGPTDAMVEQARRFVSAGFGTLKIKTGMDAAAEIAAVGVIREAVGPGVHLKLDANQAWSLIDASRFLSAVERYDIQMVEQPLPAWNLRGAAELRRRVSMPVMLDEGVHGAHDAARAIEAGACDLINIKLVKTGGLHPALALVAVAESAGVPCQIGTLDTSIGSAAAVHLVHARPWIRFAEINGPSRASFDLAAGFRLKDGCASVAAGPGLGLAVEPARLPFSDPAPARPALIGGSRA